MKTGNRLEYRLNGHLAFWVSLIVMGHGCPIINRYSSKPFGLIGFNPFPLDKLYDNYPKYAFAALVFSFILSIYIYAMSFRKGPVLLAEGGNSGNHLYDFYIGRELNPRIGSFDWKYFCELRPGKVASYLFIIHHLVVSIQGHTHASTYVGLSTLPA